MLILSTRKKGNHQVIVGPQNRGKAQARRYLFLRHGDSHIPLLGHKAQKISLSRQSGKLVLPTVYVYVGHTTQWSRVNTRANSAVKRIQSSGMYRVLVKSWPPSLSESNPEGVSQVFSHLQNGWNWFFWRCEPWWQSPIVTKLSKQFVQCLWGIRDIYAWLSESGQLHQASLVAFEGQDSYLGHNIKNDIYCYYFRLKFVVLFF